MDLQKYCDDKVTNGYGSALYYYDPTDPNEADSDGNFKYHLLVATQTLPTLFGSSDTTDFDLLTCKTKGQVKGKTNLESVEVPFMWHRDNIRKLEALQGKQLNLMQLYGNYVARTAIGTIEVRPNEISSGSEVLEGTMTITPLWASPETMLDARDYIKETIAFTSTIPNEVSIGTSAYKLPIKTDLNSEYYTLEAKMEDNDTDFEVSADTNESISISRASDISTGTHYGIVLITAKIKETYKNKYADWTTSIAIDAEV